jgi:hypothetical protein
MDFRREHLLQNCRIAEFVSRDVRRVMAGDYELRDEVSENLIYILRLWHARGER